ncbi:MAG: aldose 1-epimerase family protein [Oscillospiraceae bacterium]|jgi:galactose mutarotase-like enzyme|nr:aldose 1-epimerase family protein [Oscillospiraceae bacterium]
MKHKIENSFLRVEVKEMGAELSSVFSKDANFEYLWQGNPDIWYGQSPILFPIVGRLIDDKYTLGGKEYTMPKHGLARKRPFALQSATETEMIFVQSEDKKTLKAYPYKFDLIIKYMIQGKTLSVEHTVVNKNEDVMYFSLGAHPGFNCEIGDELEFEQNETLDTEKIDLVESLRIPKTTRVLTDSRAITITEHIFDEDALILSGIKSSHVTLKSKNQGRTVKFTLGGAPYLGVWAKPGAPYVCIEPWFGVNDSYEKKADFSQKDQIQSIPAGGAFSFTWSAEVSG